MFDVVIVDEAPKCFASGKSLGILVDVYGTGGDLDRDGVSEITLSYPLAKGDTSAAGNRGAVRALSGAGDSPSRQPLSVSSRATPNPAVLAGA